MTGFSILRGIFPFPWLDLAQIRTESILTMWSSLTALLLRFANREDLLLLGQFAAFYCRFYPGCKRYPHRYR